MIFKTCKSHNCNKKGLWHEDRWAPLQPGWHCVTVGLKTKVYQSPKLRPPWNGLYLVISCNTLHYTSRNQNKEQVLLLIFSGWLWFRLNSACDRAWLERGSQWVYQTAGPSQNQRHWWWILFIIGGSSPDMTLVECKASVEVQGLCL